MEANMGINPTFAEAERQIADALSKVRYGTVLVTLHDARVVQIEISEKLRFDPKGRLISDTPSI
jgi:hypothetical protein